MRNLAVVQLTLIVCKVFGWLTLSWWATLSPLVVICSGLIVLFTLAFLIHLRELIAKKNAG